MNNIDNSRTGFFPNAKPSSKQTNKSAGAAGISSNSYEKQQFLDNYTKRDAKVEIPDAIKDFSKIKKIADAAPDIDNTDKIASLKAQIADGSYQVNYDALADKILGEEFGYESR